MTSTQAHTTNPFPGLRPFREDEADLFFARDEQVRTMGDKLAATRFLAVVGTSGSGKSSLVNCGLLPALREGLLTEFGSSWRIAKFRPGGAPIREMAEELARDGVLFQDFQSSSLPLEEIIETTLRMSKRGLLDIFQQARTDEGSNLLVIVDQFEELFRYHQLRSADRGDTHSLEEAKAFVNLLLEAREQTDLPIHIVLTMRSDFLGDCPQFLGLAEAINEGQYLVPRLTRDARRTAIAGPIDVAGAEIEPVLLTRLVNDVGDDPDQLSILQHALNRTWAKSQTDRDAGHPIGLKHYESIGTMSDALDKHANAAYDELGPGSSPEVLRRQQICERLFKAITDTTPGSRGVRRPTRLGLICELADASLEEVSEIIEVFREPSRSFLMPPAGEPLQPETVVDISHESLLRIWKKLKRWAAEETQSARTYQRLAETAMRNAKGDASLLQNPELPLALKWREEQMPTPSWARRYEVRLARYGQESDFESTIQFIEQSRKDTEEKERLERNKRNRFIAALAIVAVVSAVVAFVMYRFWSEAEDLKVVESAKAKIESGDFDQAGLLLQKLSDPTRGLEEAQTVWRLGLLHRMPIPKEAGRVTFAALHKMPNDTFRVIAATSRGKNFIWKKATDEPEEWETDVRAASFSADGNQLVTVSKEGELRTWPPELLVPKQPTTTATALKSKLQATSPPPQSEEETTGTPFAFAFSPNGRSVVALSSGKELRIWSDEAPHWGQHSGHKAAITAAAFSPDSKYLVTASWDGEFAVWEGSEEAASFKKPRNKWFKNAWSPVVMASFFPSSKAESASATKTVQRILTAHEDGKARIWDLDGNLKATLEGHKTALLTARFFESPSMIVTSAEDGTIRFWDWDSSGESDPKLTHRLDAYLTAFSFDGLSMLTVHDGQADGEDHEIRIWNPNKPFGDDLDSLLSSYASATSSTLMEK